MRRNAIRAYGRDEGLSLQSSYNIRDFSRVSGEREKGRLSEAVCIARVRAFAMYAIRAFAYIMHAAELNNIVF